MTTFQRHWWWILYSALGNWSNACLLSFTYPWIATLNITIFNFSIPVLEFSFLFGRYVELILPISKMGRRHKRQPGVRVPDGTAQRTASLHWWRRHLRLLRDQAGGRCPTSSLQFGRRRPNHHRGPRPQRRPLAQSECSTARGPDDPYCGRGVPNANFARKRVRLWSVLHKFVRVRWWHAYVVQQQTDTFGVTECDFWTAFCWIDTKSHLSGCRKWTSKEARNTTEGWSGEYNENFQNAKNSDPLAFFGRY